MSALDMIINSPPRNAYGALSRLIMALLAVFVLWASFAHIQEYALAQGEVVPQEQIQSIQHLEGGIIEKIHVYEGDHVKAEQPLVQLNITSAVASKEEVSATLESLTLKKARLQAEAEGKTELTFSENFKNYRDAIKASEQQAFQGRRMKLDSTLMQLRDQLNQRELDVTQLKTERASIASNLAVLQEKLKISQDLVKDKLTSKLEHLQLKSEVEELQGRLSVVDVAIPRAESALAEAKERLRGEELTFRNQAAEELTQVEMEVARLEESLARATDQVQRTTIKSPIDGIVKKLRTHTIGGVVKPGDVIMEIVPLSANLVVEAHLDPKDIGFVKTGQDALVKINTYDYARFGGLPGKVISVSADSHMDEKTGEPYFLVTVRTDKNFLGSEENSYAIAPGMQTVVDIETGNKTVMDFLLKPILQVKEESFRER